MPAGGTNKIDLTGQRFGRLTVLKESGRFGSQMGWLCLCDCGQKRRYRGNYLRCGAATTCGCAIGRKQHRKNKGYGEIAKSHWTTIVTNARTRKLPLNITAIQAWKIFLKQNRKCALSGVDLTLYPNRERTASLDRIDSSKGYTRNNVQWIHKRLNTMKMAFPQQEFIDWCKKVAVHNES